MASSSSGAPALVALVALVGLGLGLALVGACDDAPSRLAAVPLGPVRPTRIQLDGELDEPAWNHLAIRGVFQEDGHKARPYSEVRFLRDETHLFLALYAADEDIRSDDAFEIAAGPMR